MSASVKATLIVLLLAALLRVWGLEHGMPRNYVPDNTVVRAALSLGRGTNPFLGEPLPTQYPYLLPYALAGVYGSEFLLGLVSDRFETVADFERFAFDRPEHFFLVARWVVAVSGTLMVLLVMLVARMVMDQLAAVCAGLLTATSLILVQLSHQARPHVVGTTILLACLWLALRAGRARSDRCLLGSWVSAGLAASTVPYALIGLAIPLATTIGYRASRQHRAALAAGGMALVAVVVVICFPRIVLDPAASFSRDTTTGAFYYFDGLAVASTVPLASSRLPGRRAAPAYRAQPIGAWPPRRGAARAATGPGGPARSVTGPHRCPSARRGVDRAVTCPR